VPSFLQGREDVVGQQMVGLLVHAGSTVVGAREHNDHAQFRKNGNFVPAIAGLGAAGLFAHFCLSNAFRAGDASVVVPLDFLRIPLIAVIGWWLYDEPLDVFVFAGAGIIISGILWNLRSEVRRPLPPLVPAENVKTG